MDRLQCHGIKKDAITDPWRAANPSLGMHVIDQFYWDRAQLPKHKHHYKLTRVLVTSKGDPFPRHNIYWQCQDSRCWAVYFTNRQALYEELTRKQVEQTWPQ